MAYYLNGIFNQRVYRVPPSFIHHSIRNDSVFRPNSPESRGTRDCTRDWKTHSRLNDPFKPPHPRFGRVMFMHLRVWYPRYMHAYMQIRLDFRISTWEIERGEGGRMPQEAHYCPLVAYNMRHYVMHMYACVHRCIDCPPIESHFYPPAL